MEPNAHYVLVSTREHGNSPGPVELRSYRIVDGVVTEEEVVVEPPDHDDVVSSNHRSPESPEQPRSPR
jgi:hypothetical protein